MEVRNAAQRGQLARDIQSDWECACRLSEQGVHRTSIAAVLAWLVNAAVTYVLGLLGMRSRDREQAWHPLPRATYLDNPAGDGESRAFRNSRAVSLMAAYQGSTTLREVWERSVEKHADKACIHTREITREVTQDETYTDTETGERKTRAETKYVMPNHYETKTYRQIDEIVRAVGAGLVYTLLHMDEAVGMIAATAGEAGYIDENVIFSPTVAPAGVGASAGPVRKSGAAHELTRHVAIYAETKAEWMITAQACFRYSLPIVTAYATLGLDALAFSMDLTDTRIIVTDEALLPSLVQIMNGRTFDDEGKMRTADMSALRIVVFIPRTRTSKPDAAAVRALRERSTEKGGPIAVVSYAALQKLGRRHADVAEGPGARAHVPTPETTACIMFTSGTTGLPKGVEMTHGNMVASVGGLGGSVPHLNPSDIYLGYLPLAHVLELVAETALYAYGCSIGYASPRTITDASTGIPKVKSASDPVVRGDAPVLRPTLMAGVPAVFDRVRRGVEANVRKEASWKQRLFWYAFNARNEARKRGEATPLWNKLVFDPIRTRALGGRLRMMLSGGGPLSPETEEFISTVLCAPIAQGYGLTETTAAGTINWADDRVSGRVGPPVMCADIKLVDWPDAGYLHTDSPNPRGEVYIAGPCITKGYYKNPEKTAESFRTDSEGRIWFATGDIGELQDGVLSIIDRKKDLFKLAHGEYIAPSKIEGAIVTSPLIDNVMIHANSMKDYCVAVVVPNPSALRDQNEALAEGGLGAIASRTEAQTVIRREIDRIAKEKKLSRVETPRKIILSDREWTAANGLTTESMKIKRHAIAKTFAAAISAAYRD